MGERIRWFGARLVEWLLDRSFALMESSRAAARRFLRAGRAAGRNVLETHLVLGERLARFRAAARVARWRWTAAATDVRWRLSDGLFRALAVRNRPRVAPVPAIAVASADADGTRRGAGTGGPETELEGRRLEELRRELTLRQADMQAAEIRLESRRKQVERRIARLDAREASLAALRRALDRRECDLRLAQEKTPPKSSLGQHVEIARRETEWWEKQLGNASGQTPTAMRRNRSRFDPTVASALRKSRAAARHRDG